MGKGRWPRGTFDEEESVPVDTNEGLETEVRGT